MRVLQSTAGPSDAHSRRLAKEQKIESEASAVYREFLDGKNIFDDMRGTGDISTSVLSPQMSQRNSG